MNMNHRRRSGTLLVLAAWIAALSGCASQQPASPEADARARTMSVPEGKALVYVIRPEEQAPVTAVSPLDVWINGERIGSILPKGYYVVEADPGLLSIQVPHGERALWMSLPALQGSKYYVEVGIRAEHSIGLSKYQLQIKRIDESQTATALACCGLLRVASASPAPERVPPEVAAPPREGTGAIIVYRALWASATVVAEVSANGRPAATLPALAVAVLEAPPGRLRLRLQGKSEVATVGAVFGWAMAGGHAMARDLELTAKEIDATLGLDVEPGTKRWIRFELDGQSQPARLVLRETDEATGLRETHGLRLAGPVQP